jgi:hypothetical protein
MGEQVHVHGDPALTDAYINGIESWMVLTIVAAMPMLWAMSLIMQMSRPYIMRVLNRLGLRFGADVWWLSYVLIRDFVMIATFALGFIFLVPDLARSEAQPLFGPLAMLFLFWALMLRLTRDADDNPRDFAAVTTLTAIGAVLFFVPMVFGVKAMGADEGNGYVRFLVSSTNWAWSKWIIVASWVGILATGGYIFNFFLARSVRTTDKTAARRAAAPEVAAEPAAGAGGR